MKNYSEKKYLTIGEVSNITEVPAYTLRYWESEFKLLSPMKRESGQRRYTRSDLQTVEKIKRLLYEEKYSIAGAKKHMIKEKKEPPQLEMDFFSSKVTYDIIKEVKEKLLEIKRILEKEI